MAESTNNKKALADAIKRKSFIGFLGVMFSILAPERQYYILAIAYGIGISLLSLATPISVQMLVNTVANTGLRTALIVLSGSLFVLLLLAALLIALRIHLMDVFGRHFYARMVSEISLRAIYAIDPYFDNAGRSPLFNRYFDIIIVQKMMPNLVVGGITLILQAIVGFIIVSLYHPYFLVFNLAVVLLLWLIWTLWGRPAVFSAIELSHRKHMTAAWLEEIGASDGFYKSEKQVSTALKKTDAFTSSFIQQHIRHFRQYFSQTLCFLFVYAAGSATLLSLGGWLVMQGQLNLGQLVAAEIVLSVVFFGVSQFGVYLVYFYDLCGAIDELSQFYDVEQEDSKASVSRIDSDASLSFINASGEFANETLKLNFEIPAKARVLVKPGQHNMQQLLTMFMKGQRRPLNGFFSIGKIDTHTIPVTSLRREIMVMDQPRIVAMTIREYLEFQCDDVQIENLHEVMELVELEVVLAQLDKGIDTKIATSGWPLSLMELTRLKLAGAIIAKPRILMLGEMFDLVPKGIMKRALDRLKECHTTILHCSWRTANLGYDYKLLLDANEQKLIPFDLNENGKPVQE